MDILHETRSFLIYYAHDCLQTFFCFYVAAGLFKLDFFQTFGQSKFFNTALTWTQHKYVIKKW